MSDKGNVVFDNIEVNRDDHKPCAYSTVSYKKIPDWTTSKHQPATSNQADTITPIAAKPGHDADLLHNVNVKQIMQEKTGVLASSH